MIEKQTIAFPLWVEAALVIVFLIMAGIEYMHDQWFWAAIFATAGLFFGVSVVVRFKAGDKHG